MVSYLNAHDALEQRRRAAKEAGTSGRAGPRTIVSAVARLCTCARPLASILCGWRSCDRASISGAWHCRSAILIKVTSAEKGRAMQDLPEHQNCYAMAIQEMELWMQPVAKS